MRTRVVKQIRKIVENPSAGKPMRHERKGTRELHIGPYRLAYAWIESRDEIILLAFYHKNDQ